MNMINPDNEVLLKVRNLTVAFNTNEGQFTPVNDVSFDIHRGETVGLVGETGCGKSLTAHALLRLIPALSAHIASGTVLFDNLRCEDLLLVSESRLCELRGSEISMVFQEPMTALNPVYTVGEQIMESIELHLQVSEAEAEAQTIDILHTVGISSPEMRIHEYPHQLSGGMRQRVLIAMALCCHPALLIADEPTTALDVTIQAQILDLIRHLQFSTGMSVLLITHDLAVVAESCDRVLVMYASKIVESTNVKTIFADPLHPYTRGLFQAIPDIEQTRERLNVIPGFVPSPLNFPTGCKFHERCNCAQKICREKEPELQEKKSGHFVACHLV